jgi:hypothetical protein
MYRGGNSAADLQNPYITGVMAYARWNAVYKGPNEFDWTSIDSELNLIINQAGKKAMLDVTAGYCPTLEWPAWMRRLVASRTALNGMGCHPLQFWDPVYIGLYKDYIQAVASHLAHFDANDARPTQTDITFVRAEVMAATMENLPSSAQLSKWRWQDFTPAGNGRIYQVDLTDAIKFAYQEEITLTYQRELARAYTEVGLPPAVAVAKGGDYWEEFPTRDRFVAEGVWLGQHSGSPNPQGWYYDLYTKVRGGQTRGASETHGKAPQTLLAQYTYWEVLANLHYGIEFIGIYGNNKFWPALQPKGAVNYLENRGAMEFGTRYAGHYRNPATSPGAWIALRGGYPEDRFGASIYARRMWTNYEFLITQPYPQRTMLMFSGAHPPPGEDTVTPIVKRARQRPWADEIAACENELTARLCQYLWQQPNEYLGASKGFHLYTYRKSDLGSVLYCGAEMFCTNPADVTRAETMLWARRTKGQEGFPQMYFDIDNTFARSLRGRATVRVVYLDQGSGKWELRYDSTAGSDKSAVAVQKTNSNQWKEVVVELRDVAFMNRLEGGTDLSLNNGGDDDDIFHMIEVLRVSPEEAPVP